MKKLICMLLCAAMLLSCAVSAGAYIAGDPNNDFRVTADDARFALRVAVKLDPCDPESDQFKAADTDGNGKITAGDARTILRVAVKLESFPDNTSPYGNITATKVPYKTNGLTVNTLSFDDYGNVVLDISNNTGKKNLAVSSSSFIPYKIYNTAGNVIDSSSVYVNQMNEGEHCTAKISRKTGMARLIFGAATVRFTEAAVVIPTTVIDGITVSKAPFTVSGIQVTQLTPSASDRKLHLSAENKTGKPVAGSVYFLCYDAAGQSKGTISVSLKKMIAGEKSRDYTYFPAGTAKIVFSKVNVYDAEAFKPVSNTLAAVNGVSVNQSPFTSNGLTFTIKSISDNGTMSMLIKNNTGSAITNESEFYYKQYDADGYVISMSRASVFDLNPGESCQKEVYLEKNAAKVLIGNVTPKKGAARNPGKTTTVDGITVNLPQNFGGLNISDFKLTHTGSYGIDISVKCTNNTGKPLAEYSTFRVKALTEDDVVTDTKEIYVNTDLNNGEFHVREITLSPNAKKVYFFPGELKEGKVFPQSSDYATLNGIQITKAPHSNNGLTVTSYQIKDGKLFLVIKNNTGKVVKNISSLSYKVIGTDGEVIRTSNVFCEAIDNGESCEVSFYIPDDTAKITFGTFDVRT